MTKATLVLVMLTVWLCATGVGADERPPACVRHDGGQPGGLDARDRFEPGEVVLTFDDGPYPGKTEGVLAQLAQHGMSAAFFVLGRNIDRTSYALLARMEAEGHTIGSHSYNHDIEMASRGRAVDYIRGQHAITRMLIEIALMATSGDDFDAMYARVLERTPRRWLDGAALRDGWPAMALRHRALLAERGHAGGRYAVRYSRPPGGGPYLGGRMTPPRLRNDRALRELGMLNVMWHGESGDVDAHRAREHAFLSDNIVATARRGGVLLIHDYVRPDALASGLKRIADDPTLRVIALDVATERKYRQCPLDGIPAA